jgi:hypothetical protein
MLYFKDVPVVIEPGVGALEVGVVQVQLSSRPDKPGQKSERLFYVPFERVNITSEISEQLPLIASSSAPHVFTMDSDIEKSPFLLVYDYLGKLRTVYTRDAKTGVWLKNDAAPEQIGDTITQFSVRLSFNSAQIRDDFLDTLDNIVNKYARNKKISRDAVVDLIGFVAKSKVGPVVLPVAVAKAAISA